MTRARPYLLLLAAVLVGLMLVPLAPGSAAPAADDAKATPLTVRLIRLSPAVVPARGLVTMAGTVTNDSEETWQAINVHPFVSRVPITSRDELAAAAATTEDAEVGTRLVEPGQFAAIGDLDPGRTARFVIRIPVAQLQLTGGPGIYWIGVHALGQNATGRDTQADGRARTFIPLVRGLFTKNTRTSVSLVVPIREKVRRDPGGRLQGTSAWSRDLAPDGRLRRIADLLAGAGTASPTVLVDPAVVEAVESVATENPALTLGPAGNGPGASPSSSPISTPESPDASPSDGPEGNETSRSFSRIDAVDRDNAAAWLSAFSSAAASEVVLGLGYADPDTASLARRKPAMLARAARLSASVFERLKITATPTIAPPDGWLDDEALDRIDPDSLVLVSDHAAPRTRTQWRTSHDQDLVFTDAEASSGGPAPTEPLAALALRQRVLAEAALRAAEGSSSTMVVQLPADWDPGSDWQSARLFEALQQPWLRLTGLTRTSDPTTPVFTAALGYPAAERKLEVGAVNVDAAHQLVLIGTTLKQLLRSENTVDHVLSGMALSAVSYQARADQTAAAAGAIEATAAIKDRMAAVEVVGTDFVTLSGGTGTLAVTLVNGLDQPITVGVEARDDGDGVRIATPDPLEMAPGERTVLRLRANASSIGVHEVTLAPVTADGEDAGTPLTLSLRTSEVGNLIWYVLIAGGALLAVMIGRRILRGVREHRWRGQ